MAQSLQQKMVQEELEAHIADRVEDLVASGISEKEARAQALAAFGDFESIEKEVMAVHIPQWWNRLDPVAVVVGVYAGISFVTLVGILLSERGVAGTRVEPVILWWIFGGIIGGTMLLIRWMIQYYGLKEMRVVWPVFFLVVSVSMTITGILDIDNFEVNLHILFLATVLVVSSRFFWRRVTVHARQCILYGFGLIALWSTLTETAIFDFIGTARCLFITPDTIPLTGALADCQQVAPFSGMLLPIYLVILIEIPYLAWWLLKYTMNASSPVYRKAVMTMVFVAMPIAPLVVTDVNNYGELDVIPWKADIYAVYWDVLGRRPEEKDIQFYAQTRTYERLDDVREVLYMAEERHLKIDMVYLEVLGRNVRRKEFKAHQKQRDTIDAIYAELRGEE